MISSDFYKFCKEGDLYNAKTFLSNKNRIIVNDSYLQAACQSDNLELIKLILNDDRIYYNYKTEHLFSSLILDKKINIINFLLFQSQKQFLNNEVIEVLFNSLYSVDFVLDVNNEKFIYSFIDAYLNYYENTEDNKPFLRISKVFAFNKALPFYKYVIEHNKFILNNDNELNVIYGYFNHIEKSDNSYLNETNEILNYLLNSKFTFEKADFEYFLSESILILEDCLNNHNKYSSDPEYSLNYIFNVFEKIYNFVDFKNYISHFLNNEEIRINSIYMYNIDITDFLSYLKETKPKLFNQILAEYNKEIIDKLVEF